MKNFVLLLLISLNSGWAAAAARMISHGYMNCIACHETALGKGILTPYGNSVDSAQSLARDQYQPASNAVALLLRGPGQTMNQDLRIKMQAEEDNKDLSRQKAASSYPQNLTSNL